MTEEEAKAKWCFAAVASHTNPRAGFETPEQLGDLPPYPKNFPCIGSSCMAWRWDEPWTSQTEEGVGGDIVIRLSRKPGQPMLGFCGLAGRSR